MIFHIGERTKYKQEGNSLANGTREIRYLQERGRKEEESKRESERETLT